LGLPRPPGSADGLLVAALLLFGPWLAKTARAAKAEPGDRKRQLERTTFLAEKTLGNWTRVTAENPRGRPISTSLRADLKHEEFSIPTKPVDPSHNNVVNLCLGRNSREYFWGVFFWKGHRPNFESDSGGRPW
jgi:hypothetical protein